ncbi:TetR/AcrR family transcriptional regulator [Nocardia jejuensis]|uniref:TetR/AcrR family transcriptional regulator n=1 Tax=Nocardia jejuensis TaxID=328049 RepID=UPI000830EDED|nr:TetR/AcrR family transcriptional regulator [Nocardia jejuensis]
MTVPARRTQAGRRAATIGKLIEATIATIAEIGYHRASLGEISKRSGVSKGGILRHFDSRIDLVVAAAEEVGRRHIAAFDTLLEHDTALPIIDLLRLTRAQIRHDTNTVWFELLVAARTEPELRSRLAPVAEALIKQVEEVAAATLRGDLPADRTRLLATSIIHMLDGEAIFRHTFPRPDLEEARLHYFAALADPGSEAP